MRTQILLVLMAFGAAVCAEDAAQASKDAAKVKYPALRDSTTPMGSRVAAEIEFLRALHDPILDSADWPMRVADAVALTMRTASSPATTAARTETPLDAVHQLWIEVPPVLGESTSEHQARQNLWQWRSAAQKDGTWTAALELEYQKLVVDIHKATSARHGAEAAAASDQRDATDDAWVEMQIAQRLQGIEMALRHHR